MKRCLYSCTHLILSGKFPLFRYLEYACQHADHRGEPVEMVCLELCCPEAKLGFYNLPQNIKFQPSGIEDFSCISKTVIYCTEFVEIVGQDIFGDFTHSLSLFVVYANMIVIFNM